MTKRIPWKWILVAVAIAALAGVFVMRGRPGESAPPAASAASSSAKAETVVELAPSDVLKAETRELTRALPISGSLRAVNSAVVKARVAGELQGLTVREGDVVQAGQVVARVDPTEALARVKQSKEQADSAKAQIDIAQRQWNNNKSLVDQGFISKTALDTSWHTFVAAEATYKAAMAAVDMAQKNLDDAVLRAPISGVVSQRLAQPGERVAIDGRVLEIVDLRALELEATLSASDSMDVQVGQAATLQVEGSPRPIAARVARINPSAQAGSRGVVVYLAIQDPAGLRQGLFAQGSLATGNTQSLAVPLSAMRTDKPAPYVQVVDKGRVAHVPVQPGARGDAARETWIAVQGLAAGATVIKGHVGTLREGTAVKYTQVPAVAATTGRTAP